MKRKGKILLALLAVALLVCIATVTLVACGEKEDSEPSNPQGSDGHTHEAEVFSRIVDPTCTEPGSEGANCTICGEYFTRDIAPLGHDLEWSIQELNGNLGDEVLTGTIHLTCKRNPYEIYDIEGTAVRTQYTAPTCDTEGSVTYNAKGEYEGFDYDVTETIDIPASHDWDVDITAIDEREVTLTLTCKRNPEHTLVVEHVSASYEEIEPYTCTQDGVGNFTVSTLIDDGSEDGYFCEITKRADMPAHHKDFTIEGRTEWNADHTARSDIAKCGVCGEELEFPCIIEVIDRYDAPDCREQSHINYKSTSTVPGSEWYSYTDEEYWTLDHTFGSEVTQEFSCYENGYTASLCSVCGELYDIRDVVEAHHGIIIYCWDLDHHWQQCTVCNDHLSENSEHTYNTLECTECKRPLFEFESIDDDSVALTKFNDGVSEIVIPSEYKGKSVTRIGDNAFWNYQGLQPLTIPNSVQIIGSWAFYGCTGLQTVTLGESVQSIESSAFYGCTSLTTVNWNATNCTSASNDVFSGCTQLATLNIGENVQSIPDYAFEDCTGLQTVTIGDGVTSIGENAFSSCTGLQTVTIGEGLQSIDYNAFYGCTGIVKVNYLGDLKGWCEIEFEDSSANPLYYGESKLYLNDEEVTGDVNIPSGTTKIGSCAFCGLVNITSITIPDDVQSINDNAFSGCTGLQTVNWNATNCTKAGYLIFGDCIEFTTVNIGENVQSMPNDAFSGCTGIVKVNYLGDLKGWCEIKFDSPSSNPLYVANYDKAGTAKLYVNDIEVKDSVNIPTGTSKIDRYAFYGLTGITSVTIPDSVTSIGNSAFNQCVNITTLNWNAINCTAVVDSEYNDIFAGCARLTTLNISENVQSIPVGAFSGCTGITKVNYLGTLKGWCEIEFGGYGANPLYVANNNKFGTAKLYVKDVLVTEVKDLDGLTAIPTDAFYGLTDIILVTIPDSVTSIGSDAFRDCTGLQTVTIGKGVQSIGQDAFAGCTYITTATYPASAIGYIPQDNLTTVTITIGEIGDFAFSNCTGLQTVTIGAGVTSIGENAFSSCTGLQTVTIGEGLQSIDYNAFYGCTGIVKVNYLGDLKGWCEIEFEDSSANPLYYGESKLYLNDEEVTDVKGLDGVTKIPASAFDGCTGITSVTIPESVQSIDDFAFYQCTGLSVITIPDSVTSIGREAFYGCTGITKVNYLGTLKGWCEIGFEDYTTNPLYWANNNKAGTAKLFLNDELVTEIKDLDGLTKIPYCAFYGLTDITSITIPDSVTSVDSFLGCTNITTATYPALAIDYIPKDSLTTVTITSGEIGNRAFQDCTGLHTVTIGEGVRSIGYWAFFGCTGLQTVTIGEGVQRIGSEAFSGCTGIAKVSVTSLKGWCEIEFVAAYTGGYSNPLYAANHNKAGTAKLYLKDELVTEVKDLDGVAQIHAYAFCGCTDITSVTIPDSITSIGGMAFEDCTGITKVNYLGTLKTWCEIEFGDNPLNGTAKLYVQENGVAKEVKENVEIPAGTTNIGKCAFYGLTSITSVTIPDSVTSIGGNAFASCTGIIKVNYLGDLKGWCEIEFNGSSANPSYSSNSKFYLNDVEVTEVKDLEGVKSISDYAFIGFKSITSVTIPESVQSIGREAFCACTGLLTAIINAQSIGSSAFSNCRGLQTVTICNSVQNIGDYAFTGCAGLQTVVIGTDVTSIGYWAFFGCTGLKDIYYAGDETQWSDIQKGEKWDEWGYSESSKLEYQMHYNSTDPEAADAAGEDAEAILQNAVVDVDAPKEWAKQD